MDDEVMRDTVLSANHSPKRAREEEIAPHIVKSSAQVKRLRKAKTHAPIEKDRTRGRYACLGHRMKHKRCPLDCPERRPKPEQDQENATKKEMKRISRNSSSSNSKKHTLQLQDCIIESSSPQESKETSQDLQSLDREPKWDSVEWEGLGWDNEHCLRDSEDGWLDLKSSSHWEESKSRDNLVIEDTKPTDDLTKFEEEEIVDSWLNEDGFGSNVTELDTSEGNATENGGERRTSIHYNNLEEVMQVLPKILLTRDMLERFLNEPYFNRLVQGCFVKVKIGEYKDTSVFQIAYIDEVRDSCFYSYDLTRGQTTKGLALQAAGCSKKVFPILAISNSPPTEMDLRTFQEEMEKNNICLDIREVQQKEEIVRVLHIKYPTRYAGESSPPHHSDADPMINEPTETLWN